MHEEWFTPARLESSEWLLRSEAGGSYEGCSSSATPSPSGLVFFRSDARARRAFIASLSVSGCCALIGNVHKQTDD